MYSVFDYGTMLGDRVRTGAYAAALHRCVHSDSVVLDLGTGGGVWALVACRLGARKVYAVDPNDAIHLGEQLAAANGFAERITFIKDLSTRISLPEPVNVTVADLHGPLPQYGFSIASLIDARRFLAPGATMIPRQETVWAAVVEDPVTYRRFVEPWDGRLGVDLGCGRDMVLNSTRKTNVDSAALLTAPYCWCTLDYQSLQETGASADFRCEAIRGGVGHGLLLWFDSVLADGVGFSNAPGCEPTIFGQTLFPWMKPVSLNEGDAIAVSLQTVLVENDYVWTWKCRIYDGAQPERVKAAFEQSTFRGMPLSLERLHRDAPDHVPERSPRVVVDHMILACVDGRASLEEIATRVMAAFPGEFATVQEAMTRVRAVVNGPA